MDKVKFMNVCLGQLLLERSGLSERPPKPKARGKCACAKEHHDASELGESWRD